MTQPEALRLADMLENNYPLEPEAEEAAAGLRRLHKENEQLRQALLQPDNFVYSEDKSYRVSPATGSFGIGDTPSKHEPEWIDDGFGTMWKKCGKKDCGKFVVKIGKVDCWNGDCPEATAPPKREWQGLTDEESIGLLQKAAKHKSPNYCTAPEMAVEFGRLASEVLREKNT